MFEVEAAAPERALPRGASQRMARRHLRSPPPVSQPAVTAPPQLTRSSGLRRAAHRVFSPRRPTCIRHLSGCRRTTAREVRPTRTLELRLRSVAVPCGTQYRSKRSVPCTTQRNLPQVDRESALADGGEKAATCTARAPPRPPAPKPPKPPSRAPARCGRTERPRARSQPAARPVLAPGISPQKHGVLAHTLRLYRAFSPLKLAPERSTELGVQKSRF